MRVYLEELAESKPAEPENFTGRVWRTDYIVSADRTGMSGLRFWYEPRARSYWHVHDEEQAIIGVFGTGLVCWEGLQSAVELGVGDWWHVQPGVPHWHGATAASPFAHLAVTAGGRTHWSIEVTDDEYDLRSSVPR